MRLVRSSIVILSAVTCLLFLRASVMAQAGTPALMPSRPAVDEPQFTWQLTVTIEAGGPLSATFNSRWTNTLIRFPVGPGGLSFQIGLPTDATQITASVSSGSFAIVGTTIYFTLTGTSDVRWGYRTAQSVVRSGNQLRIDQRTSSNNFYRQISIIEYPPTFPYVGTITFTPQLVTTDTLRWDLIVPRNSGDRHVFQTTTWLVDPALSRPDLAITSAGLSIDDNLNPPIAHLTATVRNNSIDMLSNPAYVQFYSRLSPSSPPATPIDHTGGWCGSDDAPACPASATFTNPVPSLSPGQSLTLTTAYSLTDAGLRDFYLQIDTFGGPLGLNAESDESNNIYTLTTGVPVYYLAGVNISGPVSGLVNVPYQFTAHIVPTTVASLPLTYTWSPSPESGQGTDQATYRWSEPDLKALILTVSTPKGVIITGTHTLTINVLLYLPIIHKS